MALTQFTKFFSVSSFDFRLQEGAFALAFKSKYYPGECVASRRGSPLLVGIKTKTRLATDHIPILYGKGESPARELRFSFIPVSQLTIKCFPVIFVIICVYDVK